MLSEDPIRNGLNYYTYCRNNPLMFVDPFGLAEVMLRAWFNQQLDYIQSAYSNTSGSLDWNEKTKTATIKMSANGYSGSYSFTVGVNGAYINTKNNRIYVDDSSLWKAFTNVIDPPSKKSGMAQIIQDVAESVPLTNYVQAIVGRDYDGNKLTSSQRIDKLNTGLQQSADGLASGLMVGDVQLTGPMPSAPSFVRNPNQQTLYILAQDAARKARAGIPISKADAEILDMWAKEYGVPQHHPAVDGSGEHFPGGGFLDHTHIYNVHVPYTK